MATASRTRPDDIENAHERSDRVPMLRNGDRLNADEFLRRYKAMPHLKKAELLDGRVYISSADFPLPEGVDPAMASPVSFGGHSRPHFHVNGWVYNYCSATPGLNGGDNGTVRLDMGNVPQPDVFLLITANHGGQTRVSHDDYVEGAPELVVEIARSSVNYDLHDKLETYRLHGVREYIVLRTDDHQVDWFVLREGQFDRLSVSDDGWYRSVVYPGLWLDPNALLRGDLPAINQALQAGLNSPEHAAFVASLQEAAARGNRPAGEELRP